VSRLPQRLADGVPQLLGQVILRDGIENPAEQLAQLFDCAALVIPLAFGVGDQAEHRIVGLFAVPRRPGSRLGVLVGLRFGIGPDP
jgi:hypothetical protein